jgi:hypothetical protein
MSLTVLSWNQLLAWLHEALLVSQARKLSFAQMRPKPSIEQEAKGLHPSATVPGKR